MLRVMNSTVATQTANAFGPELFTEPEAFYRTALESLSEGVMVLDDDCRIIYANRLIYEITGYSPEELLGQTPGLLKANPAPTPCQADDGDDGPKHFEFEMKRKDGRLHWINVKSTPYRRAAGAVAGRVVALSCIARQKNLEAENEFLQDEFRSN